MDGIRIKVIKGRFVDYLELTADDGYCFYDKDEEERNYLESITTPMAGEAELSEQYIVVKGNAAELNGKLDEERQRRLEDDGSGI